MDMRRICGQARRGSILQVRYPYSYSYQGCHRIMTHEERLYSSPVQFEFQQASPKVDIQQTAPETVSPGSWTSLVLMDRPMPDLHPKGWA